MTAARGSQRCAVAAAAVLMLVSIACRREKTGPSVIINGHALRVELADTEARRRIGLSGRPALAADEGMLFIFDRSEGQSFWMKDCYFPIDIAFIDDGHTIVRLATMLVEDDPVNPTTNYTSGASAKYVLETVGGTWERIGAQVGMKIELVNVNPR